MATAMSDRTVAYYYDEEIGSFNYGGGNPMRPHRVRLTHSLVENYDLPKMLKVHRPTPRTETELEEFHADDYVSFLQRVTPDGQDEFLTQMRRFNLGPVGEADCPVFDGMFEYCALYSGGSVGGAALLNKGNADVCLNWAGGMHHAKKAEASGFCYVNDIVLAILELLKTHARVLYVDIDIHHGDGVEEAFLLTDRVMTVSFHKYGDFFPGTGALGDVGTAGGSGYSVNVPLQEGMDDESYRFVFEPIMAKVMEVFQPGAIVVCGGADSLSGDRLGCFNLSLDGHASAIDFLARFRIPMLVLGGGGYTMRNVARCWAYETGKLLGLDLPDELPEGALDEYDYYVDTHRLRIAVSNMRNANTREGLAAITRTVLANLTKLPPVPSVPFAIPPPPMGGEGVAPEPDMDVRGGGAAAEDARVAKADDGYGSDAEAGARNVSEARDEPEAGVKAEAAPAPAPLPGTDEAFLAQAASAGVGPGSEAAGVGGGAGAPAPAPMEADGREAAGDGDVPAPSAEEPKEEPDDGAAPMS